MDNIITSDSFQLQLKFESCLRLLTKKHNELSKKLTTANLDKKDSKFKVSDVAERRSSSESKPYKKVKLSGEKTQKSFRAKSKRTQPAKSQFGGFPEKSSDLPKVQKNDSNRFWSFVDCYCTDITSDDVKLLEKWIESHDKDVDYQNVPDLGQHYSAQWIEDEILDERREGTKSMENANGMDITSIEISPEVEFLQKIQEKINTADLEQPPLVEKLISSLVQENIITSPNDIMTEFLPDDNFLENAADKSGCLDTSLENRLRSKLAEIDVLERENEVDVNDELLQELKRLQTLLIPISEFNLQKKKALLLRAKAEIAKQEAQKRIQEIDAKIMESYRMMAASRFKGKKMSKKELSQIRSMLDERDAMGRNTRSEN